MWWTGLLPTAMYLVELAESGEVYYYTRGKQLICRTDAGGLPEEENPASEHSTEEENPASEFSEEESSAGELSDESETTDFESVYYLHDGHGNVRMLTDAAGNITDAYSYNAYGVLLTKEGDTDNSYLYNAEQQDSTTGLYYLRARYMNPLTATFTQKDSYEGDIYSPVT